MNTQSEWSFRDPDTDRRWYVTCKYCDENMYNCLSLTLQFHVHLTKNIFRIVSINNHRLRKSIYYNNKYKETITSAVKGMIQTITGLNIKDYRSSISTPYCLTRNVYLKYTGKDAYIDALPIVIWYLEMNCFPKVLIRYICQVYVWTPETKRIWDEMKNE